MVKRSAGVSGVRADVYTGDTLAILFQDVQFTDLGLASELTKSQKRGCCDERFPGLPRAHHL